MHESISYTIHTTRQIWVVSRTGASNVCAAGVAVVANMPADTCELSQAGIDEEPQDADPGVHGLSLLEYMDLIASEETAEQDASSSSGVPWMSSMLGAGASTESSGPHDAQDGTCAPASQSVLNETCSKVQVTFCYLMRLKLQGTAA
jgi:hypothetical protein